MIVRETYAACYINGLGVIAALIPITKCHSAADYNCAMISTGYERSAASAADMANYAACNINGLRAFRTFRAVRGEISLDIISLSTAIDRSRLLLRWQAFPPLAKDGNRIAVTLPCSLLAAEWQACDASVA